MNRELMITIIVNIVDSPSIVQSNRHCIVIGQGVQGLLYHRTCKPDFLCSWPSLNSYLK